MAITTTNLGKVSITPKGNFISGSMYEKLDLVYSSGSSYLSKIANNLSSLSDTGSWQNIAEKGAPFLYADFTPEQILTLQQPATEASSSVNLLALQVSGSEALRISAETTRSGSEALRISAETSRSGSEVIRVSNENLRISAESARSGSEVTRQTIYSEFPNMEHATAEALLVLEGRIGALESMLSASVYNSIQAETVSAVNSFMYKGAEMILTGSAAPTTVPDFEGQFFINTAGGITYQAKGIASAADWKQTSN